MYNESELDETERTMTEDEKALDKASLNSQEEDPSFLYGDNRTSRQLKLDSFTNMRQSTDL